VTDLGNRVVGARIRLNNGEEHWAILLNISLSDPRATKQFLSVTVEKDGDFFALARYFDLDFGSSGPKQLAEFLGLRLNDIFPISYDIATLALGDPRVLSGSISTEPDERLPDDERSKLAVWSGK